MALVYSVANGGFVQGTPAAGANKYLFPITGELEVPAGLVLPYQYVKSSFTMSTVTAVFRVAGSSDYNITITSTANDGTDLVTHVDDETITPVSGETVAVPITVGAIGADRILKVSITQGSGSPATDLTITIE
jgi:hypothetical protein